MMMEKKVESLPQFPIHSKKEKQIDGKMSQQISHILLNSINGIFRREEICLN